MDERAAVEELERRLAASEEALREARAALRGRPARHAAWGGEPYRSLFQTMGQGYGDMELVRDAQGRAVDHRYLELNPAFERLFGIPAAEALGRRASEVFPIFEPWWHERFDAIARHGEPERIEHELAADGRWFEVFVYPRSRDRLTVLYDEVTDRRRHERSIAFLAGITDDLSRLEAEEDILAGVSARAGAHFGIDRFCFVDVEEEGDLAIIRHCWHSDAVPPVTGRFRRSHFLTPAFDQAAGIMVVEDTATDPRTNGAAFDAAMCRAFLVVPFHQDGVRLFVVTAIQATPRRWRPDEIELMREVTTRICLGIQRARAEGALRESEARFRQFAASSSGALWIRDAATLAMEYVSPAIRTIYGVPPEALLGDVTRWAALVVPEDRDLAAAHLGQACDGRVATHEFRIVRPGDRSLRWIRDTDFPLIDGQGRVQRIGGIAEDVTELKRAQGALAATETRQRALLEGIPQLVWRADHDGDWTWASPQWTDYTGQSEPDSRGAGWLDTLHPDDRATALDAWEHAAERGGFEVEYRVRGRAEAAHRWFQTRATPVRDGAGAIVEWLGTSTDIHDLRELQARQGVLVAELQHRTRNLIGVVRSMSRQTMARSIDLADFEGRFNDRLAALARVQGHLSRLAEGERITFDDLIRSELSALTDDADRVVLDGPDGVALRSGTVQILALALHELATNAVKYGAFSQPGGRLQIRWRLEPAPDGGRPWLHVDWRERDVAMPPGRARPPGHGSGRELIERALPYQLGARTTYVMAGDGVHCTVALPVSGRQAIRRSADA